MIFFYITMVQSKLNGYISFPLHVSSDKSSGNAHYLYYKEEKKRTLFVCNIPVLFLSHDVELVMSCFGKVANVTFEHNTTQHKTHGWSTLNESKVPLSSYRGKVRSAHVRFKKANAVKRALKIKHTEPQPYQPPSGPHGVKKWLADYKAARPNDIQKLNEVVNKFMARFDQRTEKEKEEHLRKKRGPKKDKDGWQLVTYKNPFKRRRLKSGDRDAVDYKPRTEKKEKKDVIIDIYGSAKRRMKKQQLALLKRRFDEDKKKLAEMRSKRKFKPF